MNPCLKENTMKDIDRIEGAWPVFELPDDDGGPAEFTGLWQDRKGRRYEWAELPAQAELRVTWYDNLLPEQVVLNLAAWCGQRA